ncbi:hypothetical protein JJJ10_22190 [Klebsiella grimontii]|uniref:hypothetical protein n=1 Tax=Klebsiella grimontii TaxID=2058152 RepID=UPI000E352ECB|nr:hypothetical protein [Klebsiella grimontii]RFP41645.1 hypothetical protein DDJ34_20385 [Klebsiella oxytoca]MBZ6971727.1 hypothetical protein [Klebsiella grimontii]MBZ7826296.1 hypothetical protein [Klebsiella grimontii]MDM4405847.1 hypothetical protein [Klebsiella grimontii]QTP39126.1 hypothetical protein JJJ10_22190 [Klebsiella grimontii]
MSLMEKIKAHRARNESQTQLLLSGRLGLAKLFWYYWFPLIAFINILYYFLEKPKYLIMLDAFAVYIGFTVSKGTWNIIKKGNVRWAVVALILIVLNLLVDICTLVIDISAFIQH